MEPGQLCSDDELDALIARNAVAQFDEIRRLAEQSRRDPSSVRFDADLVRHLHSFAVADIFPFAGQFRDGQVTIGGTPFVPPPAEEVPKHVDDMLKYVVDHWN